MSGSIQEAITALFSSYELQRSRDILNLLSPDYRSRGGRGQALGRSHLSSSLWGDFRNLSEVRFTVDVLPIQVSKDGKQARVDVLWRREARIAGSGQVWAAPSRRSTLEFQMGSAGPRLLTVEGEPILGLTDPAGVLTITEGRLDGVDVRSPVQVSNGMLASAGSPVGTAQSTPPPASGPPAASGGTPSEGRPGPRADVQIQGQAITLTPPNSDSCPYETGQPFGADVTLINAGAGESGPVEVEFSMDGSSIASVEIPNLAPGADQRVHQTLTAPASPGRHGLTVIVVPGTGWGGDPPLCVHPPVEQSVIVLKAILRNGGQQLPSWVDP